MRRILVVDDEPENRQTFRQVLERGGYSVLSAPGAEEALRLLGRERADLVLSDVAMPGTDGLELCRRLKSDRRTAGIPVILISGVRMDEKDQAEGIEQGADDYLLKPFTPRLLKAKVEAVLRRFAAPAELGVALKAEGLVLDVHARTVTIRRRRVALTRKEFDLLTILLAKRGRVLRVPYLLDAVWGYDPAEYNDPHTVEVHVSTLRRKLGARLARRIVSVPGFGYRFEK